MELPTEPPTQPPTAPREPPPAGTAEMRVDIRSAGERGDGAYAAEAVAAGTWVGQYIGEPVSLLQTVQRYTDSEPEYLFQITPELYLDAMDSTHFSRYFNHAEHGNLNFTVNKTTNRVDFYTARPIEAGEELTFDYGMAYWAGSGVVPFNDSRDYSKSSVQEKHAPKGPRPVTPTSLSELDELLAKADDEEMRGGMLRALEYFGATRLDTHAMRIPRGLGPEAPTEDIDLRTVPTATLEQAARACIEQAAELSAARAAEAAAAAVSHGMDDEEVALSRRFQGNCPPFATPEANAAALTVLLLWSFPDKHSVTAPLATERWEELLSRLRQAPDDGEPEGVLADLEGHAPRESIDALMAGTRRLCAEGWG